MHALEISNINQVDTLETSNSDPLSASDPLSFVQGIVTFFFATFFLLVIGGVQLAHAQKITHTVMGVAGEDDSQSRGPLLSASTENIGGATEIQVEVTQRNREYQQYPIRVEFYVNRRLVSKQVRSAELPGPLGVTVSHDTTSLPFNYTVIAEVIHPEGTNFPTILNAAVFSSDLRGRLDCTLSLVGETNSEFVENGVSIQQTGNETLRISFNGSGISSDDKASFSFTGNATGGTLSGSGSTTINSGVSQANNLTGTITQEDSGVSALDLSSSDGSVSFRCS